MQYLIINSPPLLTIRHLELAGSVNHKQCGLLRAVPEIILGGGTFFFRPLHPQDTHGVRAPRPPGHVSALINPPHYGANMPWPPGQVTLYPPHPLDTLSTTPPPPQDKQVPVPPPPRIISGTALTDYWKQLCLGWVSGYPVVLGWVLGYAVVLGGWRDAGQTVMWPFVMFLYV